MSGRKVLILSCNTGGGHNSCSKALKQVIEEAGDTCQIEDALGFISPVLSEIISKIHVSLYKFAPKLSNISYNFSNQHPELFTQNSPSYKILTSDAEKLFSFITENSIDIVICPHIFPTLTVGRLYDRLKEVGVKTSFIATDYSVTPFLDQTMVDWYFIPDESTSEDFQNVGIPKEKIIVSGIPVGNVFYQRMGKAKAKAQLGIQEEKPHLLMMCGSMGCGPMEKLAKLLGDELPADSHLSIVCGTNKELYNELTIQYGNQSNITVYGFTDQIPQLMDSADLYLTKPGGLSTTEALGKRLPMVLVDAVGGCEELNLNYFISIGSAMTAKSPKELTELCVSLLKQPQKLMEMEEALNQHAHDYAAEKIYSKIISD